MDALLEALPPLSPAHTCNNEFNISSYSLCSPCLRPNSPTASSSSTSSSSSMCSSSSDDGGLCLAAPAGWADAAMDDYLSASFDEEWDFSGKLDSTTTPIGPAAYAASCPASPS